MRRGSRANASGAAMIRMKNKVEGSLQDSNPIIQQENVYGISKALAY